VRVVLGGTPHALTPTMYKFISAALMVMMFGGVAAADHDRDQNRDHDRGHRENRPAQRADRHVVSRRPVYANNGRFVFGGGVTHAYTRPVTRRYYNARVRPVMLTENYQNEPGYVWVNGNWTWSGREWLWGDGHYVADPQYSTYYDDGSYDYQIKFRI
jgi:hypothetical protein